MFYKSTQTPRSGSALADFFLCFLSAALLVFSFPKIDVGALAWIALVPFLLIIDGKNKKQAFGAGYLTGLIFFAGCFYWFAFIATVAWWVSLLGAASLVMYLAVYFGIFGAACAYFSSLNVFWRLAAIPSSWVVLEFIRAHFLSGFGWVSLGQSQYKNWAIIQIADITGEAGISFLVVVVNCLIKETIACVFKLNSVGMRDLRRAQLLVFCLILLATGYGIYQLRLPRAWEEVKVAVVQPNIAQELKWVPQEMAGIIDGHLRLSRGVLNRRPDLVVWPETSFPGFVEDDPALWEEIKGFAREIKTPLIMGLVVQEGANYFNSALLISDDGFLEGRYDKLHLVAFGEYLPLRRVFPFLNEMVPIEDFSSGKEFKVFSFKNLPAFSALICFEDTVSGLVRGFVKSGARFLVNMTNDAWFQDSKAPLLHLQAAIFRTVENRRALVRCANTGVSGFIDPLGRIIELAKNKQGKTINIEGAAVAYIPANSAQTFYTKFGDVFTMLCFVCILAAGFRKKSYKI